MTSGRSLPSICTGRTGTFLSLPERKRRKNIHRSEYEREGEEGKEDAKKRRSRQTSREGRDGDGSNNTCCSFCRSFVAATTVLLSVVLGRKCGKSKGGGCFCVADLEGESDVCTCVDALWNY